MSYRNIAVTDRALGATGRHLYLRRLRLERVLLQENRIVHPAPDIGETWAVVCGLPLRQRAVLALCYYEDVPEAEIATIDGPTLALDR